MIKIIVALLLIIAVAMTNTAYAQHLTSDQRSEIREDKTITNILDICHTGLLIYKDIDGKIAVVCIIDKFNSQLINVFDQTLDINVDVKNNDDNGDGNRHHHHDKEHNHDNNSSDNNGGPDRDCLFNASLSKCAPDEDGHCPDGFNMNEDGNCFPDHHGEGCPDGYHGVDDDETGQCYKNKNGCPDGMEFRPDHKTCTYKQEEPIPIPEPISSGTGSNDTEPLDSNCGGVPCTSSEKEDSTTSDPITVGEPLTPTTTTDTDNEEIVKEKEVITTVDQQPEQNQDANNDDNNSSSDENTSINTESDSSQPDDDNKSTEDTNNSSN